MKPFDLEVIGPPTFFDLLLKRNISVNCHRPRTGTIKQMSCFGGIINPFAFDVDDLTLGINHARCIAAETQQIADLREAAGFVKEQVPRGYGEWITII